MSAWPETLRPTRRGARLMPLACLSCRCRLPALLLPLIAVAAPAWANEAPRRNTLPGLSLAPVAAVFWL